MRKHTRTRGFTLIELLVVIAIIALLAAILFPVFAGVKRSSYQATCSSNLGQFASAFTLYADDWGGRLPLPGGVVPKGMAWIHSAQQGESVQIGALWKYIKSSLKSGSTSNLWSCPLAVKADLQGQGYSPGQNYIMNDYIRSGHSGEINGYNPSAPGYTTGFMLGVCPRSSLVILMYEGVQNQSGYCSRLGSLFFIDYTGQNLKGAHRAYSRLKYPNIAQDYHNGRSNYLFLDGHVRAMRPEETWSKDTYDLYRSVGDFWKWSSIYPGYGEQDMWNPRAGGVSYP